MIQRTYNFYLYGEFETIPFAGPIFLTTQIYLSNPTDIKMFNNKKERELLDKLYKKLIQKKILLSFNDIQGGLFSYAMHYKKNYNAILKTILSVTPNKKESHKLSDFSPHELIQLNKLTTSIGLKLFSKNYSKHLRLAIANINFAIGGYYFVFTLLVTGCFFIWAYSKTYDRKIFVFILIMLTHASNYALIAIVQPALRRFTFYTDTIQWAFWIVFLSVIANHIIKSEQKPCVV